MSILAFVQLVIASYLASPEVFQHSVDAPDKFCVGSCIVEVGVKLSVELQRFFSPSEAQHVQEKISHVEDVFIFTV